MIKENYIDINNFTLEKKIDSNSFCDLYILKDKQSKNLYYGQVLKININHSQDIEITPQNSNNNDDTFDKNLNRTKNEIDNFNSISQISTVLITPEIL